MTRTQRILPAMAGSALVLALVTGCGGDGGGRPSVEELSQSIQDSDLAGGEDVDPKVADCVAEAFHESDLSDDALQAIVDQDEDYDASKEDEEAIETVTAGSLADCLTDGLDMPELEEPDAS